MQEIHYANETTIMEDSSLGEEGGNVETAEKQVNENRGESENVDNDSNRKDSQEENIATTDTFRFKEVVQDDSRNPVESTDASKSNAKTVTSILKRTGAVSCNITQT